MDQKKKILIIEDDYDTRHIYQTVLGARGFICDTAEDGTDGLSKIQAGGYDMVLLDMMMPVIDGLKVLEELKNKPPQSPNGPIIVTTNLSHVPAIDRALELGAYTSLIKSDYDPQQLVNKLNSILEKANG